MRGVRLWWWITVAFGGLIAVFIDGSFWISDAARAKNPDRSAVKPDRPTVQQAAGERPAGKPTQAKSSRAKQGQVIGKPQPAPPSAKRPAASVVTKRRAASPAKKTIVKQSAPVKLRAGRPAHSKRRTLRVSRKSVAPVRVVQPAPPPEPVKDFVSVLLEDAETGRILLAEDSDKPWPAASLTKMMVGLLAFEDIERGRLSLQTPVFISERASKARQRKVGVREGEVFPLEELLQAMMVTSANDAAVAVAERVRGSVEACVAAMNRRARELGMDQTYFQTVNGFPLPDGSPGDISSAHDIAILARVLMRHPQLFAWTALDSVPFRNGLVMLPNTNHLVGRVEGVNGLKTGYTAKARFNLVATAQRGSLSLIAVVLGGRSSRIRFETAQNFLEWGFALARLRETQLIPPSYGRGQEELQKLEW